MKWILQALVIRDGAFMRNSGVVLTFGEIMMRLSPPANLRLEQATTFDVRYGGAEANVAFSLAYQGDKAAFLSVVPENRIGDGALRSLSSYGVDTSRVLRTAGRLGTYYMEFGASQRGNQVVYDRAWSAMALAGRYDFDWEELLADVSTFYFSGITPAVSPALAGACSDALVACRERGIETVCDLNYRGKMWPPERARETMARLLPLVDVCIANDEDAPSALGITKASGSLAHGIEELEAYRETAEEIRSRFGCSVVASVVRSVSSVESSRWMGLLCQDEGCFESVVHDVHVLEGVGAGDAFSAGLLHARAHGFTPQSSIDYAIAASVLKLSVRGDVNYSTSDEISTLATAGSAGQRVSR